MSRRSAIVYMGSIGAGIAANAAVGANQLKVKAVSKYQEQEIVAQSTFGIEVRAAQ